MSAFDFIKDAVQQTWQRIFRLTSIKNSDNFFELGGHSLTAAKITAELAKKYKLKTSVTDIFKHPTVQELTQHIANNSFTISKDLIIRECTRVIDHPLSLAQNRLWFLYKLRPEIPLYSIPLIGKVHGALDSNILRLTLNFLMERHESLRTKVKEIDGNAYQTILPTTTPFPFEERNLSSFDQVDHELKSLLSVPFCLEEDILCRCILFHVTQHTEILCFLFHHLIFDDWSMDVFIQELNRLYSALYRATDSNKSMDHLKSITLGSLSLQYMDFSVSQADFIASQYIEPQLAYWRRKLSNLNPIQLPIDFPRPFLLSYKGNILHKQISSFELIKLKQLAANQNVSLFMLLLALFKWILALFSNAEEVIVGSPVSNRPFADLKSVIGYFVNTLVLRTSCGRDDSFLVFLEKVKSTVLEAYGAQDVPFERIVSELNVPRELNRNPCFQCMFSISYAAENAFFELDGVHVTEASAPAIFSKFDLSLHASVNENSVELSFEYLTELFREDSVAMLADAYLMILDTIPNNPTINLNSLKSKNIFVRKTSSSHEFNLSFGIDQAPLMYNDTYNECVDTSQIENSLAEIWKALLNKNHIPFAANFFELGGSSLLVIRLCDLIEKKLQIKISVIDIFQYPTIKTLSKRCCDCIAPQKQNIPKLASENRNSRFHQAVKRFANIRDCRQ